MSDKIKECEKMALRYLVWVTPFSVYTNRVYPAYMVT